MKRAIRTTVILAALTAIYAVWPSIFHEVNLRGEAQQELGDGDAAPIDSLRRGDDGPSYIRVGQVVTLRDGSRIRPVSNSHHNGFIFYDGTTYVRVGNELYRRSGGHCGPVFLLPGGEECDSAAALKKWLLEHRFRDVTRR